MRAAVDGMVADTPASARRRPSPTCDRQRLAALGYVGTQTGAAIERDADRLPDPKDKIDVLRLYRAAVRLSAAGQYAEAASGSARCSNRIRR